MSISRWDYVPNQPNINTYVPLPYEQLYGAINRKQGELDKAKEQEYQLRNLAATIKTDPYSEQYIKPQVLGRYTDRINTLADTIAKGDDYNYKREINKLTREYSMDQDVQNLVRSGQNYDLYQKDKAKDPNNYAEFYDPYERGFRQTAEGYQGGNVPFFRYEGMKGKQDYVKRASDLVSNIAEDKISWEGYKQNPDGTPMINSLGQVTKLDGSREYLDQAKLNKISDQLVPALLQTNEGKYYADELLGRDTSIPGNEIRQEEIPLIADKARTLIRQIGSKQLFEKTGRGIDNQNLSDRALDKLEADNMSPVTIGAVPAKVDAKYNVDIPISNPIKSSKVKIGGAFTGDVFEGDVITGVGSTNVEEQLAKKGFTPEQKVILEKAKRKYGIATTSKLEEAKLINRFNADFVKEGISYAIKQFEDPKQVERENLIYFNPNSPKSAVAAVNRGFKLIDGEGNKELTGKEFMSKFGNQDKYNINVTGTLTPDNNLFSAGRQITVTDKEGNEVAKYAMSGNRKEMDDARFKHEFYQPKYNPTGQHTITLPVLGDDGKVKNEKFTIDYEVNTSNGATMDEEGRPRNTGSRARLLDSSGKPVIDWIDDNGGQFNSLDLLYNALPR